MQMHQYNVENLLCNYLKRYSLEYPFLKVKVLDSAVIISLGHESCNTETRDTYQEFFELEKYDIKTDIQTLEKLLMSDNNGTDISCEKISETELLVTRKREVLLDSTEFNYQHQTTDDLFINFNDFMEYIKTNKRSILFVPKKRYLMAPIANTKSYYAFDPIPVSRYNYVLAVVSVSTRTDYIGGSGIHIRESVVTREKIESLDKNTFKVYILKESEEEVCYEILNKSL